MSNAPDGIKDSTPEVAEKLVHTPETGDADSLVGSTHEDVASMVDLTKEEPVDPDTALLIEALGKDSNSVKMEMKPVEQGNTEQFDAWFKMYDTIFTDPVDKEDYETMLANWNAGRSIPLNVELEMNTADGRVIQQSAGIVLAAVDPSKSAGAYVPYGGIDEKFRGRLPLKRVMANYESALKAQHVDTLYVDCEDPSRAAALRQGYEGLTDEAIARIGTNRLAMFRKNGYDYVDDKAVQYCRPASEDTRGIQGCDLLGFKIIGNEAKYEKFFIRDDNGTKTHITRGGYRTMYLEMMMLDQGSDLPEAEFREEFPAVDDFLTRLDASSQETFTLYKDPPRKRREPKPE